MSLIASRPKYISKMSFNFALKTDYVCSMCRKKITAGMPYYNLSISRKNYTYYFLYKRLKVCPDCLKEQLIKQKKYLKEGGFDIWLKEKVATSLMRKK